MIIWTIAVNSLLYILLISIHTVNVEGKKSKGGDKTSPVKHHVEEWGDPVHKEVLVRPTTGPGCPYAAAWLTHVSLFCATTWYMESTKMETATFNIFTKERLGYQLVDPDMFYVNHMSMYEHWIHKKEGFGEVNYECIC